MPAYTDYFYKQAISEVMSVPCQWPNRLSVFLASQSSNSAEWKRIQKSTQFTGAITNNGTDGAARPFTQSRQLLQGRTDTWRNVFRKQLQLQQNYTAIQTEVATTGRVLLFLILHSNQLFTFYMLLKSVL